MEAQVPVTKDNIRSEMDAAMELEIRKLRGEVENRPNIIYEGLQELGLFSANTKIDTNKKIPKGHGSLVQFVKEWKITPSGQWVAVLSEREIEAVRNGVWCANCYQRQPTNNKDWKRAMARTAEAIGQEPPEGSNRKTRCPYCGTGLGIVGTVPQEIPASKDDWTEDQQQLIEEFFGGEYAYECVRDGDT